MLGSLAQLPLRTFKAKRASNKPRISDLTERYCETLASLFPLPEAAVWPIFFFQSSSDSVAEGHRYTSQQSRCCCAGHWTTGLHSQLSCISLVNISSLFASQALETSCLKADRCQSGEVGRFGLGSLNQGCKLWEPWAAG